MYIRSDDRGGMHGPAAMYYHISHMGGARHRGLPLDLRGGNAFAWGPGGRVDPSMIVNALREELAGGRPHLC